MSPDYHAEYACSSALGSDGRCAGLWHLMALPGAKLGFCWHARAVKEHALADKDQADSLKPENAYNKTAASHKRQQACSNKSTSSTLGSIALMCSCLQ